MLNILKIISEYHKHLTILEINSKSLQGTHLASPCHSPSFEPGWGIVDNTASWSGDRSFDSRSFQHFGGPKRENGKASSCHPKLWCIICLCKSRVACPWTFGVWEIPQNPTVSTVRSLKTQSSFFIAGRCIHTIIIPQGSPILTFRNPHLEPCTAQQIFGCAFRISSTCSPKVVGFRNLFQCRICNETKIWSVCRCFFSLMIS